MFNYIRYLIVAVLFFSLFYTYNVNVSYETIRSAIDKKLPFTVDKSFGVVNITSVDLAELRGNTVHSVVSGDITVKAKEFIEKQTIVSKETQEKTKEKAKGIWGKFSKKYLKEDVVTSLEKKSSNAVTKTKEFVDKKQEFSLDTIMNVDVKGSYLVFQFISLENGSATLEKVIKTVVNRLHIHIKQLDKISLFATIKKINFDLNQDLIVSVGVSKFLVFILMFLFLLREMGLLFINFYQKFLSPNKGYKCAKGHLHGEGTCSSDTKKAFKEGGFISGIKEYRKSIKECKLAYEEIKRNGNGKKKSNCDECDVLTFPCDGGSQALLATGRAKAAVGTAGLEASTGAVSSGVEAGAGFCDGAAGSCDGLGGCDGIGAC